MACVEKVVRGASPRGYLLGSVGVYSWPVCPVVYTWVPMALSVLPALTAS